MKVLHVPLLAVATTLATSLAYSQTTVTTEPVGFVTTKINPSTSPGVPANTQLSPVLLALSAVSGSTSGQISSVSPSSITFTSAGWTPSQLANSQAYVHFKSGALNGLILRVTSNTDTTATLDTLGGNLADLGAVAGDSFQLVQGDTLNSMFDNNNDGVPDGVVGGTQAQFLAALTDRVTTQDSTGVVRTYYYNTQFNQWRRFGSSSNQGALPISPVSGMIYSRVGSTEISQVTTGKVPSSSVKYLVPTSGQAFLARYFPTNGTLSSFGFQNLPGWKGLNTPGVTVTSADKVITTDINGVIRQFYWTGTQWRRFGSSTDQSNVPVPIGGFVAVVRSGSGAPQLLNVAAPYTL
jgi:hypothetical protein